MKVVLDTNVFVSGIFFSGPPYRIMDAWRRGKLKIIVSLDILKEYRGTAEELSAKFSQIDLTDWLELLTLKATLIDAPRLPEGICTDPDDDKFLACAVESKAAVVISGDKALRRASGYKGVQVLSPRQFVDQYLTVLG
jgi:uncharacterized protein